MKKQILENKGPSFFTGCTLVAVANSKNFITVKELLNQPIEVYSEADNNVVTIKKIKIQPTNEIKRIFIISFTSGEEIKVTEDYLFYLKNGTRVDFKGLKKGNSLRVITRYKNSRASGLLNRDTRLFGDLPSLVVRSIVEVEKEEVYTVEIETYKNFFIGNFRGKISGSKNEGSSIKIGN